MIIIILSAFLIIYLVLFRIINNREYHLPMLQGKVQNKDLEMQYFDNVAGKRFTHYTDKIITNYYESIGLLQNLSGKRVLECGCATGEFGKVLANHGAIVWGVDISEKMVINNITNGLPEHYHCRRGDLEDDKLFPTGCFDIILCCHFIHHFKDRTKIYQCLNKWLKSDGIIILYEPNKDSIIERLVDKYKDIMVLIIPNFEETIRGYNANELVLSEKETRKTLVNMFTIRSLTFNHDSVGIRKFIYSIFRLFIHTPRNNSNHWTMILRKLNER